MSKIRKQVWLWTTKDKQKIRICDMSDHHLINTIKLIKRVVNKMRWHRLMEAYSFLSTLQGEMAIMSVENEIDLIEDDIMCHPQADPTTVRLFDQLMLDFERRNLDEQLIEVRHD